MEEMSKFWASLGLDFGASGMSLWGKGGAIALCYPIKGDVKPKTCEIGEKREGTECLDIFCSGKFSQ